MRPLLAVVLFCTITGLSAQDHHVLADAERALVPYTDSILDDSIAFDDRLKTVHRFIPRFVAALKLPGAYGYGFDSLKIQQVRAPDDAFRIYTWEIEDELRTHRYYGAIQMNSEDLELHPLFDYSDTMVYRPQRPLTPRDWYGALYYGCVRTEHDGQVFYTLMGRDEADFVSDRKVIEVMTIGPDGPVFGDEPLFHYVDSNGVHMRTDARVFVEYNDKATVRMTHDPEQDILLFDHCEPPSENERGARFTYVPDGTYEGFEWVDGRWEWIERVFTYSIGEDDAPPVPRPILDDRD